MPGNKYDYKEVQQAERSVLNSRLDKSKSICFIFFVAFASSIITLQFVFIFSLYHPDSLLQFLEYFDLRHCPSPQKTGTSSLELLPIVPPDHCPPCKEVICSPGEEPTSPPCEELTCAPCEPIQDVAPCINPREENLNQEEQFNALALEKKGEAIQYADIGEDKKRPSCGLVWFFHITKTGGGSIADFLIQGSKQSPNSKYVSFWNTIPDFWEKDRDFQYSNTENLFKRVFNAWDFQNKHLKNAKNRWVAVEHHIHTPNFCELKTWKRYVELKDLVESQGCGIYSFTILRNPFDNYISSLGENRLYPSSREAALMAIMNTKGVWGEMQAKGFAKNSVGRLSRYTTKNIIECLDDFSKVWFTDQLAELKVDLEDLLGWHGLDLPLKHTHRKSQSVHLSDDIRKLMNRTILALGHWEFYFEALKKVREPDLNVENAMIDVRDNLYSDLIMPRAKQDLRLRADMQRGKL